jgi:hypothetical protein
MRGSQKSQEVSFYHRRDPFASPLLIENGDGDVILIFVFTMKRFSKGFFPANF